MKKPSISVGWRALAALALLPLLLSLGCGAIKRWAYAGGDRDRWQRPEEVIQLLGIKPGDHLADLGAGGGYFTYPLAEATGPDGIVYAIDVDPDMTRYLEEHSREIGADNVRVVLAASDDPSIPDASIDLLFTCNTYHHLKDRVTYFERAQRLLRPGGRVAIIEYEEEGGFQVLSPHATPKDVILWELTRAGYRLERDYGLLEKQTFLIFSIDSSQEP